MTNPKATALIQSYSDEALWKFLNDRNHSLTRSFAPIPDLQHSPDYSEIRKLGEIEFSVSERLMVCSIAVTHSLNERSGKKAQYELAKQILRQHGFDSDGIFVFHDPEGNFRFSLIYSDYVGNKRKDSNYRRFTYYVSPQLTNKTFLQRVGDGDFSKLEKIKEAFSVEKVTSKFFEEFRNIFADAKKEFENANEKTVCLWLQSKYSKDDYDEQVNKFTFTFLGRIIFLYFLLRKGWIEDQSDYVRKIFENESNKNLYLGVFVPLFFEVFAKQEKDRPKEIQSKYMNTPYLNGGLFEHSDLEAQLAKEGKFILYRDNFLRKLILEFFEVYNFTVDENSFNDAEVSIDPEMLGKVFENTLAEVDRKKKGTFYTPREIVHFMVKDSLRQYLFNETGFSLNSLQTLIYSPDQGTADLTPNQIRLIDSKLENIKVLDPAVGSAAFPVEFLNVLIELRKRLNVSVGVHVNEVTLKKHMIKNNLYGVDIDPGAIEIAKLRLWLTLIVDYDKTLAEPLPNLDFKFRVGNSLQEKVDDLDIFNISNPLQSTFLNDHNEFDQLKKRMIEIKDKFYAVSDEIERHRLKDEFDALEHQLIRTLLEKYRTDYKSQLNNQSFKKFADSYKNTLAKMETLEQKVKDGTYKLFKPDFHFSEVFDRVDGQGNRIGGFDIVIGNPPYGVAVEDEIRDWHGLGSRDSYGVFISTALKRYLKSKGVLEFIVSDTWLTIKTHRPLREQVLSKQLHKVVRLHQDCFEATVNACIISLTNQADGNHKLITADLTNISTRDQVEMLRAYLYDLESHAGESTPVYGVYAYKQSSLGSNNNLPIIVCSPELFEYVNSLEISQHEKFEGLKMLGQIADIKYGIRTGNNSKFFYQNIEVRGNYRDIAPFTQNILEQDDLLNLSEDEKYNGIVPENRKGKYIVPMNKGGESDIKEGWLPKYYVPSGYYFDWSRNSVQYLKRTKGMRNPDIHFKPGITFSWTGEYSPTFRISVIGIYDQSSSAIINLKHYCVEELLGLLNSKFIKYIIKNFIDHTVNCDIDVISSVTIPLGDLSQLIPIVKNVISEQKENLKFDYSAAEFEINNIIYDFYSLSSLEIREVETWYSRRYPKLASKCDI